jgi:hypothetical protein
MNQKHLQLRPYLPGNTGSRSISKVKQARAAPVLQRVSMWEFGGAVVFCDLLDMIGTLFPCTQYVFSHQRHNSCTVDDIFYQMSQNGIAESIESIITWYIVEIVRTYDGMYIPLSDERLIAIRSTIPHPYV